MLSAVQMARRMNAAKDRAHRNWLEARRCSARFPTVHRRVESDQKLFDNINYVAAEMSWRREWDSPAAQRITAKTQQNKAFSKNPISVCDHRCVPPDRPIRASKSADFGAAGGRSDAYTAALPAAKPDMRTEPNARLPLAGVVPMFGWSRRTERPGSADPR